MSALLRLSVCRRGDFHRAGENLAGLCTRIDSIFFMLWLLDKREMQGV